MSAAAGLIGSGLEVVGKVKEGQSRAAQARFQERENRRSAVETEQEAAQEERNFRASARRQLGFGQAQFSASGVTGGSGEEALAESARNIESDALAIKEKGKRVAAAFRRGGAQAAESARAASAAGTLGAFGAGFSGIAKFGSRLGRLT